MSVTRLPDVSYITYWPGDGDGYTKSEKWSSLAAGIPFDDPHESDQDDLFQVMTAGPFDLAPGAIDSFTVAILAGNSLADLQDAMQTNAALAPKPPAIYFDKLYEE